MNIAKAIAFIRDHKLLNDWKDEDICIALVKAIDNNLLAYEAENDKMISLGFGKMVTKNQIHIICLIAPNKLRLYLKYFKAKFPNFFISYFKKDKKFKLMKIRGPYV